MTCVIGILEGVAEAGSLLEGEGHAKDGGRDPMRGSVSLTKASVWLSSLSVSMLWESVFVFPVWLWLSSESSARSMTYCAGLGGRWNSR